MVAHTPHYNQNQRSYSPGPGVWFSASRSGVRIRYTRGGYCFSMPGCVRLCITLQIPPQRQSVSTRIYLGLRSIHYSLTPQRRATVRCADLVPATERSTQPQSVEQSTQHTAHRHSQTAREVDKTTEPTCRPSA